MSAIVVQKFDHKGQLVIEYDGVVIDSGPYWVCLRAIFQRADVELGFVTFRQGDIFIEWFYDDRWYNIFQVQDGESARIKGWYCNITRPAELFAELIRADDLALDVFVKPSGQVVLLDEDEFSALDLPTEERMAALRAVEMIRRAVNEREAPFDRIAPR
jgi:predicted RNA-binding protein associated with RNAse of E/G family